MAWPAACSGTRLDGAFHDEGLHTEKESLPMSTRVLRSSLVVLTVALASACGGGNGSGSGPFGNGNTGTGINTGGNGGTGGNTGTGGTGGQTKSRCVLLVQCVGQCPSGSGLQACANTCASQSNSNDVQLFNNMVQCDQQSGCQDSTCFQQACAAQLQACGNG
jgi:hypothetical protein